MMKDEWPEIFLDGLDLDVFPDNIPAIDQNETRSAIKTLVMTCCYGRGKSLKQINVPRIPSVSLSGIIPTLDLKQLISSKNRPGRGRAKMLAARRDDFQDLPVKVQAVQPSVRFVPPKTSLFYLPQQPGRRAEPDSSSVDSFDCQMSDDEDEGVHDLTLPSQRGVTMASHPFGRPPKPKKKYNVTSSEDFPTLGTPSSEMPDLNNSNRKTSARSFPLLPPHLSKKVDNCDIVFKPMKDKKSKKKKKSENKGNCSRSNDASVRETAGKDNSVVDETDYIEEADNTCDVPARSLSRDSNTVNTELLPLDNSDIPTVEVLTSEQFTPSAQCELSDLEPPAGDSWDLSGAGVIQINRIPVNNKLSSLEEIVTSFGTVVQTENRLMPDGTKSVRFRYKNPDSCEWAVSCLHDSDCVFPDAQTVLECFVVDWETAAFT